MPKRRFKRVVFQPDVYLGMQKGIDQIASAIRPTLGPHPRVVASELTLRRHRAPEMLDDGGVIARRIVELPDRDHDMGAMMLRHALMYVNDQVGDGTATAAVILQAVYDAGVRYIASGGNSMRLRHFLERGTRVILTELGRMTAQPQGEEELTRVAAGICPDPALAAMMAEIFDIIGEYGRLEIRTGKSRTLEREYVEGMYWQNGVLARQMITDHKLLRVDLPDAAILISDLKIEDPAQLVPVLSMALETGFSSLLVIAQELSEAAIALLLANSDPEKLNIAAVKTPGVGASERSAALLDIVVLTGGQALLVSAGQTSLKGVTLQDLGRARRAWADREAFGITGGQGDPHRLRQHVAALRAAHRAASNAESRQQIQERIGMLLSGSAVLKVGGATETEISTRRELAKRASQAMRAAIVDGVLPGGGVALLACRPALRRALDGATDADERAAYRILIEAMEEPTRTIVSNAGYEPSVVMSWIELAGEGHGFDVTSGKIVDMAQAGILDVAAAQKTAVQTAIACAATALTTDVLVHHAKWDPYKPQPHIQTG